MKKQLFRSKPTLIKNLNFNKTTLLKQQLYRNNITLNDLALMAT